jgi:hypothetical protein
MQSANPRLQQIAVIWKAVSFILAVIVTLMVLSILVGKSEITLDPEGTLPKGTEVKYHNGEPEFTYDVLSFEGNWFWGGSVIVGFVLLVIADISICQGYEYGFFSIFGKERLPKKILAWTAVAGGILATIGSLGYAILTDDKTTDDGAIYHLPTNAWKPSLLVAVIATAIMAAWIVLPPVSRQSTTAQKANSIIRKVLLLILAAVLVWAVITFIRIRQ